MRQEGWESRSQKADTKAKSRKQHKREQFKYDSKVLFLGIIKS